MDKEEIKQKVNMVSVLAMFGIYYKTGHIRCPLPDHEDKNPSFRVISPGDRYICTCSTGDIFTFVQRLKNCSFKESLEIINGTPIKPIVYKPQTVEKPKNKAVAFYGDTSGIFPNTIHYKYYNLDGGIIGIVVRYENPKNFSQYFYDGQKWCPGGFGCQIYGIEKVHRSKYVIIVEGEKDADNLQVYFPLPDGAVISPMAGVKDFTSLFNKHIFMWPDNDTPGKLHMKRLFDRMPDLVKKNVRIVQIPGWFPKKYDVSDLIQKLSGHKKEYIHDYLRKIFTKSRYIIKRKDK